MRAEEGCHASRGWESTGGPHLDVPKITCLLGQDLGRKGASDSAGSGSLILEGFMGQ